MRCPRAPHPVPNRDVGGAESQYQAVLKGANTHLARHLSFSGYTDLVFGLAHIVDWGPFVMLADGISRSGRAVVFCAQSARTVFFRAHKSLRTVIRPAWRAMEGYSSSVSQAKFSSSMCFDW